MTKRKGPPCSAEEISRIFAYDPNTGILSWKEDAVSFKTNRVVRRTKGRTIETKVKAKHGLKPVMSFQGKRYFQSNIIWYIMTKTWPDKMVDHKDGDPSNNKWSNLRLATNSENNKNSVPQKRKSIPYKGVYLKGKYKDGSSRYRVEVGPRNGRINGGSFRSLEEALKKASEIENQIYGEFAYSNRSTLTTQT